jgi:hypothetical protein
MVDDVQAVLDNDLALRVSADRLNNIVRPHVYFSPAGRGDMRLTNTFHKKASNYV